MARIVLVTGSRALDIAGAEEAIVAPAISAEVRRDDVVVTGDAPGPDAFAVNAAIKAGATARVYALNGCVYERRSLGEERREIGRWITESRAALIGRQEIPLVRNIAMVAACVRTDSVFCLAFEADWSKTRGTKQTYDMARRFGITVKRWHATLRDGAVVLGTPTLL